MKGGRILGHHPESFKERDPTNIGRGRLMPTTPFDALWNSVAQWFGITDNNDLDYILPNRKNFGCNLYSDKDLYTTGRQTIAGCNGQQQIFTQELVMSEARYLTPDEQRKLCAIIKENVGASENDVVLCTITDQRLSLLTTAARLRAQSSCVSYANQFSYEIRTDNLSPDVALDNINKNRNVIADEIAARNIDNVCSLNGGKKIEENKVQRRRQPHRLHRSTKTQTAASTMCLCTPSPLTPAPPAIITAPPTLALPIPAALTRAPPTPATTPAPPSSTNNGKQNGGLLFHLIKGCNALEAELEEAQQQKASKFEANNQGKLTRKKKRRKAQLNKQIKLMTRAICMKCYSDLVTCGSIPTREISCGKLGKNLKRLENQLERKPGVTRIEKKKDEATQQYKALVCVALEPST